MFFYLSFLRPPPTQSNVAKPVIVTPQIANDLRTETFLLPQDIYYSWIPISSTELGYNMTGASRPIKLTTWRPENAYKPIQVPPPQRARAGQRYSLALSAKPEPSYVNLQLLENTVFPVISMPISFTSGDSNSSKQEKIERLYCFAINIVGKEERTCLRITEQTSFDLDKKIWDSGIGLSGWLIDFFSSTDDGVHPHLKANLLQKKSLNVIELGAGTGMVSTTLGALRSSITDTEGAPINDIFVVSDLPSAQPLLSHNLIQNAHNMPQKSMQAEVLDWDNQSLPESITGTHFDLVVMADVTYNTASFPSLLRTVSHLLDQHSTPSTLVLLGYKQRDIAERSLFNLMKDGQPRVELYQVGESTGMGGEPVEVWLGQRGV